MGHFIENVGDEPVQMLEMFRPGATDKIRHVDDADEVANSRSLVQFVGNEEVVRVRRTDPVGSVSPAALVPLVLLAIGFVGYCWYDLSRSRVKYLPRWLWAVICLISIPLGGIVYLLVGRDGAAERG
ncbi:PLD nuclease N-terminal domain-containing protein [Nocardia sp. alder85J]|uniref:PLD nuclease N-terminal domain-containing protein n=1 Tax=Nocardia sp. alder85J TaxID=2862949 RepID=UPI001CD1C235|nr:PLD nuclease N-terminal domain-containing protein [Nocardia sp. alder85J]MCX4099167.1 hypothetical protein [Nocardia sp. alder85J]